MTLKFVPTSLTLVRTYQYDISFAITVSDNDGSPLSGKTLNAQLLDSGTDVGARISPAKTDALGNCTFTIAYLNGFSADKNYTLRVSITGGDTGDLPTRILYVNPFTVSATPALLASPGSIAYTADLTLSNESAIPLDIQLAWTTSDTTLFPIPGDDTGNSTLKSFSHSSIQLSQADIDTNKNTPLMVTVTLKTANQPAGPTAQSSAVIGYLDAPVFIPGVDTNKNVVTDNIIASGTVPWGIEPIAGVSPDKTYATLYASAVPLTELADLKNADVIIVDDLQKIEDPNRSTVMMTQATNSAYSQNGALYAFYTVTDFAGGNFTASGLSKATQFLVARNNLPDPINVDNKLAPLAMSQYQYGVDDFAAAKTLTSTLYLNGTTRPQVNDVITIYLDLTGYTPSNLGQTKTIALRSYQLTSVDIANGTPIPFPSTVYNTDGFTAAKLANIEGSNGNVYYTITRSPGNQITRSPSRKVVIATVPPRTGEPDVIKNLRWALAHLALPSKTA